jgi:choline dehydrogenase-like flavoprotein
MIPLALASGKCELRTDCTVSRIDTDERGRVNRVVYWDRTGNEHAQLTKAVVVSANGAETPRLLLLSASSRFPDGLGNSSGYVGRNLMFNAGGSAAGIFPHPVNAHKSVPVTRIVHDFYTIPAKYGIWGGGGFTDRSLTAGRPMASALGSGVFTSATWGSDYKKVLQEEFTHTASFNGHGTSLPLLTNSVSLDPNVKDKLGRPALRTTYTNHPNDFVSMKFFTDRAVELMQAAGATKIHSSVNEAGQTGGVHLLGTCRMGSDPKTSVVNKFNRSHDVPNLFMVDGGSLVTSGRGQPTMTIMALAFRAADHLIQAARRGEV